MQSHQAARTESALDPSNNVAGNNEEVRFIGKRVPVLPIQGQPPPEFEEVPSVGLLLSSLLLTDGRITAEVEFEEVTPDSKCELAIAYDSNAKHIVSAGLGTEPWAMFGIREFGGHRAPKGWWDHRVAGSRANLKAKRPYKLDVHLRGATLSLSVDGVAVGMAEVASPQGRPRHVGVLCNAEHDVTIRNFTVQGTKPKAFVVMQFSGEYEDVYQDVIQEVCKSYEVTTLRGDEVAGPGLIIADIVREISTSQLIIADITPKNPNVYFEIGYALALGTPTVLLAQKGTELPFDVAGFRVQFYEDTIGGKKRLEAGLRRHLEAILEE